MTEEIKVKMKNYGIKAVPIIVIDGNIKVADRHIYLTLHGYAEMICTKR